ncbi:hypothetical protein WCE41_06550 [Luteimonas sp. MJ246]|uniref:hypothetical protein n=1 Tax=Luteimonas sp. MJ174 TaxID=3129237 RepID=UPI0031BA505C
MKQRGRLAFRIVVVLVLVLPWFGYRQVRDWLGPGAAPSVEPALVDGSVAAAGVAAPAAAVVQPAVAARPLVAAAPAAVDRAADAVVADEVEAIGRDARAGDGEGATARLADLGAQVHRDILLADRGAAVRREAARRDLAAMPGVRGAGWVDRMTVLLVVSGRGAAQSTVAAACRTLAAHGDVSGLAVRVQEVAGGAVAAGAVQAECKRGTATSEARPRGVFPGTSLRPAGPVRGDGVQDGEGPEAAAERRRREQESLRILSENTPELPTPPDLGSAPDAR